MISGSAQIHIAMLLTERSECAAIRCFLLLACRDQLIPPRQRRSRLPRRRWRRLPVFGRTSIRCCDRISQFAKQTLCASLRPSVTQLLCWICWPPQTASCWPFVMRSASVLPCGRWSNRRSATTLGAPSTSQNFSTGPKRMFRSACSLPASLNRHLSRAGRLGRWKLTGCSLMFWSSWSDHGGGRALRWSRRKQSRMGPTWSCTTAPTTTRMSRGNSIPQCVTFTSEALPLVENSELPEFFGHRLHTLRTGHPLLGGLSFHGVSVLCTNSLANGLASRNSGTEHETAADAGLGLLLLRSDNCL